MKKAKNMQFIRHYVDEKFKQVDINLNFVLSLVQERIYTAFLEDATSLKDKFHIPFVIYAPKIFKPQKIEYTVSQLDIIPTLIDVLNIKAPYSSLGKSLFSKTNNRFRHLC